MGVRKRGKNYVIDFYVNGKRVREMVGPSKKQAEQALIQRQAEILAGKYKLPQDLKLSFAEASERYLEWSREHKRSWKDDQGMMKRLIAELGDLELTKITPWHIEQVKHRLLKYGSSGPRVNRYLTCLSSLFHRAQEWDLLSGENPCHKVRKFKENPGRLRYLSLEEVERLLAASEEDLRAVVIVALGTGMRKGEIFRLRWQDVDFPNRVIHVVNSKNGERRDVPMGETVYRSLLRRNTSKNSELVFAHADGSPHVTRLRKRWGQVCRKAGLDQVHFHDLRHTFASHLVMDGKSLFAVQELLGHKSLTMTRRYAHLAPGIMRDAVGAMDALMQGGKTAEMTQGVGHNLVTNDLQPILTWGVKSK